MTMLRRRRRRDPRAKAPKRRKRRNLVKFIPEADSDFAFTALQFATILRADPAAHGLAEEDAASVEAAVEAFRAALIPALRKRSRTAEAVYAKDQARAKAEAIVRRYANIIRANPEVSATKKALLRIKERPARLRARVCPRRKPTLMYVATREGENGLLGRGMGSGVHLIKFFDVDEWGNYRRAKPEGAARLELFVGFVAPGEPIPKHPAEASGGWPLYLRSYTRSPAEVEFPMPRSGPMMVVYWGRWADATGEVGPFSATLEAHVEGWVEAGAGTMAVTGARSGEASRALPPGGDALAAVAQIEARRVETKLIVVQSPYALLEGVQAGWPALEAADAESGADEALMP